MDNPIIFQILLGLVVIFFIFLTVMNTKTWRWVHVTMTFFVFATVIAFGVYAAMTMKTRLAWIGHVDSLEKKLDIETASLTKLTYGDPKDHSREKESVVNLKNELARTILDRGRVWRGLVVTPGANGFTLSTAPPAEEGAAAPAPVPHHLEPKTVVYAFKEGLTPQAGQTPATDPVVIPGYYLGEFQVTETAADSVTVVPTRLPMPPDQAAVANNLQGYAEGRPATWTLYEVAPIDSHEWLSDLTEEQLRVLIPQPMTGLPNDQYQKFLSQYLRDGKEADEVNDPPENIWIEVKFVKPHTVDVDAPSEASLDYPTLSGPFDSNGRARIDRLRRTKPGADPAAELAAAEFVKDDTAIFDRATAEQLIADDVATKVRSIYRRKLNDFELRFGGIHARIAALNGRIRALGRDLASLQASKSKADEQSALLDTFQTNLTADLTKVRYEAEELGNYNEAVTKRLDEVRAELSHLYRSNKALSRELTALNAQMTEEIEQRTRAATAMIP
ncbi:MAG: hypothetical protein WD872_14130 [Pirellulaceae bacterium]